jgi:hypothetical protein
VPKDVAVKVFYNDAASQDAEDAASKLESMARGGWTVPPESGYAAFKHIPSTYMKCLQDEALPVIVQELFIQQEGALFDVVQLDAGHSPFLSMPKETAEIVVRAIENSRS